MRDIRLYETKSEIGAGTRGASLGIEAVKIASLNAKSNYFTEHPTVEIPNQNHLLFDDKAIPNTPNAKRIAGIAQVLEDISDTIAKSLIQQEFPIVLAGDHSNAGGTIAGIKKAFPEKRLGVVWVDAHADLHTPYTSPSGNVHGMPLGFSLGLYQEAAKGLAKDPNKVNEATSYYWDLIKNLGDITPKVLPEDIAFVAVRDTEAEEDYLINNLPIKNYSVEYIEHLGAKSAAQAVLDQLNDCDLIYVSFDVDSMDCDLVSHGTGTPVPNGLTESEATIFLDTLLTNEKVCCFEITEVNPTLDEKRNLMAETAFRILSNATKAIESSNKSLFYNFR